MPTPTGTGRWQSGLLAQLDGVPAEARALVQALLGRPPTKSESNAASVAVHNMARLGLVKVTRVPRGTGGGSGAPRVYLLKVSRWVTSSDGAAGTDSEAPPIGSPGWLDLAWRCLATDYRYAQEMAEAAVKLMSHAERAELGLMGQAKRGDGDGGSAAEVRQLHVVDVGVKAD